MSRDLAVIGCGYWGRNLVRVFSQLGALRCVCDTDKTHYDALDFPGPRPAFADDLKQVLDDPSLPAVAVATPAATHYEVVRRCLEAGKDVFVEKPLALNARQGEELVALAQRRAAVLMVGHILLYHPAVVRLRQLIQEGALGRILYCYSNRLNMGLIRTEENILWSFAPHDISVILHLLGEEPIAAEADGQSYLTPGVVDVTLSRLKFASGVTRPHFRQLAPPVQGTTPRRRRHGENGRLRRHRGKEAPSLFASGRLGRPGPKGGQGGADRRGIGKGRAAEGRVRHFLDCLATRKPPRSDGMEGLRVLRVLDACQQSIERFPPSAKTPRTDEHSPLAAKSPPRSWITSSTKARSSICLARSARGRRSGTSPT